MARRQEEFQPPPIDREITIAEGVTVKELSEKLGIKANLPTINMLIDIATNQGLIPRRMSVDELFIDPDTL